MLMKLMMSVLLLSSQAWAQTDEQIAKIARLQGDVRILVEPQNKPLPGVKQAKIEQQYYRITAPKIGMPLPHGAVVHTGKDGRVRLVYRNGDHFTVAENTSFKISAGHTVKRERNAFDVLFGRIRAVILHDGPRAGAEVRTNHISMGVRGTDFSVVANGAQGGSEIVVLRGEVSVVKANTDVKAPDAKIIKSGYLIQTTPTQNVAVAEVKPINEATLRQIKVYSKVEKPAQVAADVAEEVKQLEAAAIAVTKKDIEKTDPELFKQITSGAPSDDVDQLNQAVVSKVEDQVRRQKPSEDDLKSKGGKVYEDYGK